MQYFSVTLFAVLIMLAVAVIGFVLKKTGAVSERFTADLSKVLIYICQPCLLWYSFNACECNAQNLKTIGISLAVIIILQLLGIGGFYLIFRKRFDDVRYRIATIATVFGNYAFFGIPVLKAMFPEEIGDLMIVSGCFALVMNVIGWSLGSYVISRDKKYVNIKKILLNPAVLILIVIIPLFACNVHIGGSGNGFVAQLGDRAEIIGKMSTPLFMLILGMRLATVEPKKIFTDPLVYFACITKQFLIPLFVFAVIYFIPMDLRLKQTLFILCCCPVASVVLNYAELVGEGQKSAANTVLLSTVSSVITIPLMTMFLQLF